MRLIKAIIDNEDGTVTVFQDVDQMDFWIRGDMIQLDLYLDSPDDSITLPAKDIALGLTLAQRKAVSEVVRNALNALGEAQRTIHKLLEGDRDGLSES